VYTNEGRIGRRARLRGLAPIFFQHLPDGERESEAGRYIALRSKASEPKNANIFSHFL